jgi:hypothetical protein
MLSRSQEHGKARRRCISHRLFVFILSTANVAISAHCEELGQNRHHEPRFHWAIFGDYGESNLRRQWKDRDATEMAKSRRELGLCESNIIVVDHTPRY